MAEHGDGGVSGNEAVTSQRSEFADRRAGASHDEGFALIEGAHDLANLVVITRVNGEEKQRANTSEMVFSIPMLLSYVSHVMTLEPGDLVATGTPAGVAPLKAGDVVEIEIEGLSKVSNRVEGPI